MQSHAVQQLRLGCTTPASQSLRLLACASPSHIFGSRTFCRSLTLALLLLLLLLLLVLPRLLVLVLLPPVKIATPSTGPMPSLSRIPGVMRDKYAELSIRKSMKPAPVWQGLLPGFNVSQPRRAAVTAEASGLSL